jgi:hypothetical protein
LEKTVAARTPEKVKASPADNPCAPEVVKVTTVETLVFVIFGLEKVTD